MDILYRKKEVFHEQFKKRFSEFHNDILKILLEHYAELYFSESEDRKKREEK